MLQVGDIRIYLISDGFTLADPGGPFGLVPRVLWQKYHQPDENMMLKMSATCLYVEAGRHKIVVDTGFGSKMDEKRRSFWHLQRPDGDILAGLARLGIGPEDITLVIDTHLHADHCSGNTRYGADGAALEATFPNAQYVVQQREYEDAIHPNERTMGTYFAENFQPLVANGQMRLLDGDTELARGIRGIVTPGHTPGHMSVQFESDGQYAAFVCDMASYAVHFEKLAWMTAYDVEPLRTLETKRIWQRWALETNAALIFPHDPICPVGRLIRNEKDQLQIIPIPEAYI